VKGMQLLVFLDVDDPVLAIAKSFGRILSTQSLDECVSTATNFLGKLNHVDTFQDDVVRLHRVRSGKRRTSQQLHNLPSTVRSMLRVMDNIQMIRTGPSTWVFLIGGLHGDNRLMAPPKMLPSNIFMR